jgi:CubicO group peptidase (beta-lactamase class C family)
MKQKICRIIASIAALVLSTMHNTTFAQAEQNSFVKDSLDKYIERGMKQWQIPGLAIAIVKDGKVIVSKGYGVREFGKPGQVDENTLFIIASNSKLFTGTSIAKLDYEKNFP